MKTLKNITSTINRIALTLIVMIAAGSYAYAVTDNDSLNVAENSTKMAKIEQQVLASLDDKEDILEGIEFYAPQIVKIVDENENVIFQGALCEDGTATSKELIVFMQRSDFMLKHENTSYYILHQ